MRKRRVAITSALVIAGASFAGPVSAQADSGATFYVDNASSAACSDSTTDSVTTPYCTIQAAVDAATSPGDTVIVDPGSNYAPFAVTSSGTAAAPITIEALAPRGWSTTYSNTVVDSTTATAPITVSGASYVNVDGFYATSAASTSGGALVEVTASTHVGLDGLDVVQSNATESTGLSVDGTSSDVTVSRSYITSSGGPAVTISAGSADDVVTTNLLRSSVGAASRSKARPVSMPQATRSPSPAVTESCTPGRRPADRSRTTNSSTSTTPRLGRVALFQRRRPAASKSTARPLRVRPLTTTSSH